MYGGIYADIDTENIVPVNEWLLPECKLVVGLENDVHFCQWVFAATPGSQFLAQVIKEIKNRYEDSRGVDSRNPNFVHYHTGPGAFTVGLAKAFSQVFKTNSSSQAWSSRQWYDFIKQPSMEGQARSAGICLFDAYSFNHRYVQNWYASQKDIGGYESWTQTATNLHVSAQNKGSRFCSAWRQTKGCDPEGEIEVSTDKTCTSKIEIGRSGFCECNSGPVEEETLTSDRSTSTHLAGMFAYYVRLGLIHPPTGRIVGARNCDGQGNPSLSCEDLCLEYWHQEAHRIALTMATNEVEKNTRATAISALNIWMLSR